MTTVPEHDVIEKIRESQLFDESWYLAQYPDVKLLGMDPLEHYFWLGARLARNPGPKFDTHFYLEMYDDVAATGQNPLEHYLLTGINQGRITLPPARLREEINSSTRDSRVDMQIGPPVKYDIKNSPFPYFKFGSVEPSGKKTTILISMVKNERKNIEEFCGHALALFDRVILIDHLSSDGTQEFIKKLSDAHSNVEYLVFDERGYYQSQLMTWVIRNIDFPSQSWVFFLDADEYLPLESRAHFDRELQKYNDVPIISLPWLNLVPHNIDIEEKIGQKFLKPSKTSPYHKIAFQPHLIPVDNYVVAQGNHALLFGADSRRPLPSEQAFPIFHIPIRTGIQIQEKVASGSASYKQMGIDRQQGLGFHWDDIDDIIRKNGIGWDLLAGLAARYGENLEPPYERSLNELYAEGYSDIFLKVAISPLKIAFDQNSCVPKTFTTMNLTAVPELQPSSSKADLDLILDQKNHVLRFESNSLELLAEKQPGLTLKVEATVSESDFLIDFLARAPNCIETLTPTAWGGHIPFMYALISRLRPNTFVELGSHYGASFFAACQTIRDEEILCAAYAVDLWSGDEHTGGYDETVFKDFTWLLTQRYRNIGFAVRKDFNDAVRLFEDESIDLLHIDGLHTYEAVSRDFETWLPKVAPNGVILFHDTTEHRDDFGVWRLWEEIKDRYYSFNFDHTHGLGVIALGTPENNPIARLLKIVNSSECSRNWFERFFRNLGALACSEALGKHQYAESERARLLLQGELETVASARRNKT